MTDIRRCTARENDDMIEAGQEVDAQSGEKKRLHETNVMFVLSDVIYCMSKGSNFVQKLYDDPTF